MNTENTDDNVPNPQEFVLEPDIIELTPKRGRGRPPKTETVGSETVKKTVKRKPSSNNVDNLSKQIEGLHIIASSMTGIKELIISPTESSMLASSIITVCDEYNLSIDGKTGAAMQLLATAAMIYAPRIISIFKQKVDG